MKFSHILFQFENVTLHHMSCYCRFFSSVFLGISAFFFIYIADMYLDDTLENQYQDEYTLFIQYS